jgi:hypothetical protein
MTVPTIRPTPEEQAARKKRSTAIALALLGLMALIFFVTIASLKQNGQLPSQRWEQAQ